MPFCRLSPRTAYFHLAQKQILPLYSSRPNRRLPPSAANPHQATPNDRPSSCPASPSRPELRRRTPAPNRKQRPARNLSAPRRQFPRLRSPADEGRRRALPLPPSGSPSEDAVPAAELLTVLPYYRYNAHNTPDRPIREPDVSLNIFLPVSDAFPISCSRS